MITGLIKINKDFCNYPIFTYKWIENKNSLSRSYFNKDYFYIERYFQDYINASILPWIEDEIFFENFKDIAFERLLETLTFGYLYYQNFLYRQGESHILEENMKTLKDLIYLIENEFNISRIELINFLYQDPHKYMLLKEQSFEGGGLFIEMISLKDFLLSID